MYRSDREKLATLQNSPRRSLIDLGLPTLRNVAFRIPAPPPHDCQYTTEQYILKENVEKCCSIGLGSTLPSKAGAFPRWASFRALTIYIPRLSRLKEYLRRLQPARVRPGQQVQHPTSTQRTPRIFYSHPTLPSQDSSPSYFNLTFGRPSSQTFPQDISPSCSSLTFRTALRVLFIGRLQYCPFRRFRHSLTFGRLLSKPSCFL